MLCAAAGGIKGPVCAGGSPEDVTEGGVGAGYFTSVTKINYICWKIFPLFEQCPVEERSGGRGVLVKRTSEHRSATVLHHRRVLPPTVYIGAKGEKCKYQGGGERQTSIPFTLNF